MSKFLKKHYNKILSVLDDYKIDCILLSNKKVVDPSSVYFGFDLSDNLLLVFRDKLLVHSNKMFEEQLSKKISGIRNLDIEFVVDKDRFYKQMANKKIGINGAYLNYSCVPQKARQVHDVSDILRLIRMKKETYEVETIKRACKITKKIIEDVSEELFFSTEKQIFDMLIAKTYSLGYQPAFMPIVATVGNSQYPHAFPSNKKIESMVLVDYGVKVDNYCSDITRCFFDETNRKVTKTTSSAIERMKKAYSIVKKAFFDCINLLEVGKENYRSPADYYYNFCKDHNIEMLHAVGHGVGIEIHELPSLRFKSIYQLSFDTLLQTCIALEPALYYTKTSKIYPKFGVRFEETVFIDKKGRVTIL